MELLVFLELFLELFPRSLEFWFKFESSSSFFSRINKLGLLKLRLELLVVASSSAWNCNKSIGVARRGVCVVGTLIGFGVKICGGLCCRGIFLAARTW